MRASIPLTGSGNAIQFVYRVLREGVSYAPAEVFPRLKDGSPLTPEEFVSRYPYLLRFCQLEQLQGDRFILEPQAGQYATYGVFFYPTDQVTTFHRDGRHSLLVRTEELIENVDGVKNAIAGGILVMPSSFHHQLVASMSGQFDGSQSLTTAFALEREMFERWPVLNELKLLINEPPVFTIPTKIEIPKALSLTTT